MLHEHIERENKMTQSLSALYVYIRHTGFNKKLGNVTFQYTLQNFKSIKIEVFKKRKKGLLYADALLRDITGN